MKMYIYFNDLGRIVLVSDQEQSSGNFIYAECESTVGLTYYVDNEELVQIPPAPNIYCFFDYSLKQWVDPRTPETQWPIVRQERDQLLQASDYTQLPDVPLTDKASWATYRQALRDVTTQTDPFNIVWPVAPQS